MQYYGNYRPIKRDFLDEVIVSVEVVEEEKKPQVLQSEVVGDNKKCMARHDSSEHCGNSSFKSMSYDRSIEHDLRGEEKKMKYVLVNSQNASAISSDPKIK